MCSRVRVVRHSGDSILEPFKLITSALTSGSKPINPHPHPRILPPHSHILRGSRDNRFPPSHLLSFLCCYVRETTEFVEHIQSSRPVKVTYVVNCGPIAGPVHRAQSAVKCIVTAYMLLRSRRHTICLKCSLGSLCETWIMVWHERVEIEWARVLWVCLRDVRSLRNLRRFFFELGRIRRYVVPSMETDQSKFPLE